MALDSRSLRSFLILAEELHFGRAAERLGIAQSALSAQIGRIEDVLGARLFERGRRTAVTLTPAGTTFLGEARKAIAQLDLAERVGRLAGRGEAGPATIGYIFSAAMSGLLTRALAALHERLPLLEVQAYPLETPEQLAAIAEGRLDLGFLRPRETYPEGVIARVVHREPLLLALSETHPLAALPAIAAPMLAGETFLIPQFGERVGLSETVARLARGGGFPVPPFVATRDYVTAVAMAAGGYGVVLAPQSFANLRLPGVCYREIDGQDGTVDLAIAYRSPSPLVETILDGVEARSGWADQRRTTE